MNHERNLRLQRLLFAAVSVSLAWSLFVCALDAGIKATPYETTDSRGRAMGFNDPLSAEHFLIILGNFRPHHLLSPEYIYALLLLVAHVLALGLLFRSAREGRLCRAAPFWLQSLLFPLGWMGLIVLPVTLSTAVSGRLDREGIIDIPFVLCTAQPVWVLTSVGVAWALRRARPRVRGRSGFALGTT